MTVCWYAGLVDTYELLARNLRYNDNDAPVEATSKSWDIGREGATRASTWIVH